MCVVSGHLALPIMLGALCVEGQAQLLGEARALYENHERDAGDTILMAFRAHNWTKVSACTLGCWETFPNYFLITSLASPPRSCARM